MYDWRSIFLAITLISLCFLCIPIKINNNEEVQYLTTYMSYLKLYNKTYANITNYEDRFKNFKTSQKQWIKLNKGRNSSDQALYGVTEFSDISQEEFKSKYLRRHDKRRNHKSKVTPQKPVLKNTLLKLENLPMKVDWRTRGVVTKVKNQGVCGACWAFSVVSAAESMYAIKTGKLQDLSVQEMIDCAGNGNLGCNGGDTCSLIEWLVINKIPIENEADYPLLLKNDQCKLNKSYTGVRIAPNFSCKYFEYIGSEKLLMGVIANHGPVAVAVNALTWQHYLGGVIKFNCDGLPENLNHAAVIVGYDLTVTTPYYIVKNSWGTIFGENGYVKIAIGGNVCGIANEIAYFDVI